ncbi:MAG: copper resistance CopC family protein [Vulcanimicrobiaceae bacterium]
MRRIAALAAAMLIMTPQTAGAHAFLDHSDPAVGSTVPAPAVMHLWFTQQLEPAFSSVAVTDRSGATVNEGAAAINPTNRSELDVKLKSLQPGTYKVKWHVLSVDTHTTEGDFTFNVRGG